MTTIFHSKMMFTRSQGPPTSLRAIVWAALICFFCISHYERAMAQKPLFSVIPKERFDATPSQEQRLGQLRRLPTTGAVQIVQVNSKALADSKIAVPLPGKKTLSLQKMSDLTNDTQSLGWTASPEEKIPAGMTIVVRDGQISGSISTPEGLYRLSPLGGNVHALIQVNTAAFPKDEPESFKDREARSVVSAGSNDLDLRNQPGAGLVQIDVLVAYTPAAKAAVIDMDATIALAVAEANQSYVNSHIAIHLNLVDSFQLTYTESGKTFDQILADFKNAAEVNQHRDHSGADLATLIVNQSDYCGLADAIMADASKAFSVVYYDCATGNYSYAHELGHLMGARHNEQIDPGAPFAYGHGYMHPNPAPGWRTIMAYNCPDSCIRLQYWSNPQVSYGGIAMGTVAVNDNARVLNETAATVAAFRKRP